MMSACVPLWKMKKSSAAARFRSVPNDHRGVAPFPSEIIPRLLMMVVLPMMNSHVAFVELNVATLVLVDVIVIGLSSLAGCITDTVVTWPPEPLYTGM